MLNTRLFCWVFVVLTQMFCWANTQQNCVSVEHCCFVGYLFGICCALLGISCAHRSSVCVPNKTTGYLHAHTEAQQIPNKRIGIHAHTEAQQIPNKRTGTHTLLTQKRDKYRLFCYPTNTQQNNVCEHCCFVGYLQKHCVSMCVPNKRIGIHAHRDAQQIPNKTTGNTHASV